MLRKFAGLLKRASAVAGVASLVALAGHAQAAQFLGEWDPAFGSPFPNLGWRGEATFEIPDACLSLSGNVWNTDSCSSNGMRIVSAEVEFYDLANPSVTQETLVFDIPSTDVLSMTVSGGVLAGVNGGFPYWVESNLTIAGKSDFLLFFVDWPFMDPYAQLKYKDPRCDSFVVCLIFGKAGFSDVQAGGSGGGNTFMTFRAVPEPGSLALMLPALGLLAFVRRRKSAVA